jgi:hypothetical protein
VCPSGVGFHYRDECDEDSPTFTDPEPEPVESTCVWLARSEEYAEERSKEKFPEKGLLVGWRDASAAGAHQPLDSGRDDDERGQPDQ